VYIEYHVGCPVSNLDIGMCPHVVKELVNPFLGVNSRGCLLCGNVRQCHQYGGVNGTGIIEETSEDLLYALLTSGVQERTVVGRCWSLIIFTVRDGIGRLGTMLWFERRRMTIKSHLFHHIFGHIKIDVVLVAIPFEVDATV
jgi:hypothetical protein